MAALDLPSGGCWWWGPSPVSTQLLHRLFRTPHCNLAKEMLQQNSDVAKPQGAPRQQPWICKGGTQSSLLHTQPPAAPTTEPGMPAPCHQNSRQWGVGPHCAHQQDQWRSAVLHAHQRLLRQCQPGSHAAGSNGCHRPHCGVSAGRGARHCCCQPSARSHEAMTQAPARCMPCSTPCCWSARCAAQSNAGMASRGGQCLLAAACPSHRAAFATSAAAATPAAAAAATGKRRHGCSCHCCVSGATSMTRL
jgi:hypothetical protein